MSSQNPALFLLPADEKFDGSNWTSFKISITEAARGRGLLGYLTGDVGNPALVMQEEKTINQMPTAWWGAANPTPDEWLQRDAYARSMVTLNVVNPIGAGVRLDGSAADAWSSLTLLHDARSDLALLHAEEELSAIKYVDGTSIEAHFKALHTAWAKANGQGAEIDDRRF